MTGWRQLWQREGPQAFRDGIFVRAKKGGEAIGITQRGKGRKGIWVTDGQGMPIGTEDNSAPLAKIHLPIERTRRVAPTNGASDALPGVFLDPPPHPGRRGFQPCIPRHQNPRRRGRKLDLTPYRSSWMIEHTIYLDRILKCFLVLLREEA